MKVAVQCKSPLLQRSLEQFLSGHLSTLKQCDIVVRDITINDEHPTLLIGTEGADLNKPFSKSQLYLALEKRFDELHVKDQVTEIREEEMAVSPAPLSDLDILERRIAMLTQEYQQNVMKAVRAFYEK